MYLLRSFAGVSLLLAAAALATAAPQINHVSVRGLQAGGTTSLVLEGAELGPGSVLLTAAPGVTFQLRPTSTPARVEADITVDAQTPPGIYLLRVASATGVSNALAVGIDALPQAPFAPEIAALPIALSGDLTGSAVLSTQFTGTKGQRVVVDIESRRLGSKLKPVVRFLDERRRQLAWGKPMSVLGGDTRCEAILPLDGKYLVELHDLIYRGEGPGTFRVKIGDLQFADVAMPLGVKRSEPTKLRFISSSLGDATAEFTAIGSANRLPINWPAGVNLATGNAPAVTISDSPEFVEQRTAAQPQELSAAPVGVSGQLLTRGEHDLYRIPVTPGQALRFDVFAHRLGSPIDATLTIMNEAQAGLASNDDIPGAKDPGLDFVVPADTKVLLVGVRDILNLADPLGYYRLQVSSPATPEFSLSVADDRVQVPAGGTALLRVHADRRGYNGPIKLSLSGLGTGITASPATMEGVVSDTLISITGPATGGMSCLAQVRGESADVVPPIVRTALAPDAPAYSAQPWSRQELAIGIAPPAKLALAWRLPANADAKLPVASRVPVSVTVERASGVVGPVRLALISALNVPKKNIVENGSPKPVEDLDRTLRLAGDPIVPADQNSLNAELIVPFDLAAGMCDATLRAELLGADGKSVVATVYSPLQRFELVRPTPEPPLVILEDQPEVIAALTEGGGQISLDEADKFSGKASARVTPPQRFTPKLPGLEAKIREQPAVGEYRYLRFVWKKPGGNVALQLAHDGEFGPIEKRSFRYQAGPGPEYGGMAIRIDAQQPPQFTVVTRDLFADFGEFTLTGIALTAIDGDVAHFDHIHLGRTPADFDLVAPKK